MKHRNLAIIIALLSGASITLLLIPAMLSNKQLWIVFFISISVIFITVWIFNEYIVFRDLHKIKMLVKRFADSSEKVVAKDNRLKMGNAQELSADLINYLNEKVEELSEANKKADLRKQFIADVSHELKSPLFSAQGYVHTLLDGAAKDKEVRTKFLKKAARNLDYLDILIQDLLTLSQLESDAISMHFEHFDLITLLGEVIEDREAKAKKSKITLVIEHDDSPVIVFGDYRRINQVLVNLVNNGINYNTSGGSVSIEIHEDGEYVVISVIDTGVGIDSQYHTKIFNRFFRIDKSRTIKKSTGLGLAIVKHILDRHNSVIRIESEVGKGSKFSFRLPID